MIEFPTPISPCISVCKLDRKGICKGCFRTEDEIRRWYYEDDEGKKKILEEVAKRK